MTSTENRSDAPKVHLFNPANDEALGSDNRWYTPTRHALQYQHDCELLPIWWANDGDYIIAPNHTDDEIKATCRQANVAVRRYQPGASACPEPWGWSRDAKRQFQEAGLPSDCLPTDQYISWIRELSNRRLAIEANGALTKESGIIAPNNPRVYTDLSDIDINGGDDCLLKRPWSSSGRGIFPTSALKDDELKRLAQGIIRRQGSVIVEDALSKVADMSALFHSDGSNIRHHAWSIFQTSSDGRYMGSIVAPQADIMSYLQTSHIYYGDTEIDFADMEHMLTEILSDIISTDYRGWIGIDMLAYHSDCASHQLQLAPCIEVNLRMTMGVAASMLSTKRQFSGATYMLRTISPGADLNYDSVCMAGSPDGFSVILDPTDALTNHTF